MLLKALGIGKVQLDSRIKSLFIVWKIIIVKITKTWILNKTLKEHLQMKTALFRRVPLQNNSTHNNKTSSLDQ